MSRELGQPRKRSVPALHDDDLRRPVLNSLLVTLALAAFLGWYGLVNVPSDAALLALVSLGSFLAVAGYTLQQRSPQLAALALCLGLVALVCLGVRLGEPRSALAFLTLPVVISGVLLRPAWAAVWGIGTAAVASFVMRPHPEWPLILLPIATGIVTWLVLRPLYHLLNWSWQRSLESTVLAEQLQDQRGKLNRTIRDLDASYQLLQQTNYDLALARNEADLLRDLRHRFATNLSHELRTPLNIILGFSKLICRKPHLYGYTSWSEALMRDLAEIQSNAAYLSRLVDDVVDLARIDALAMPIQRQPTGLQPLIQDVVQVVSSLALEKGLTLAVDLAPELPTLLIDPQRIRQVLFNLLVNAIRFTDRGSVTVRAALEAGEVVVSVTDTGRGIPEAELSTIFNEFYQVGRPKEEPEAGKGLGLAIAKRLVQLHGGRIWAESVLGQGTTFTFALPVQDKSTARVGQVTPLPVSQPREKPKVLVLDGEGGSAAYLSRRLDAYDFITVRSREELAAASERLRPVAVILGSAEADGYSGAELLLDLPEGASLIRASLPRRESLAQGSGFAATLVKPVSEEDVMAVLAEVLPPGPAEASLLLVDDDRGFVQLLSRMIESASDRRYSLQFAYNGRAALAKLRQSPPDLVLLDLVMPEVSGFEVLRQMRTDPGLEHIPVVAVSAATPGEDQLTTEGAAFSLSKRGTFRPGELVALLETSLRGSTAPAPPGNGEERQ
ncbi:MAG: response regulator [Anaerolineae bacterium]|nr:response regulator [Anaerolineae bacterium]